MMQAAATVPVFAASLQAGRPKVASCGRTVVTARDAPSERSVHTVCTCSRNAGHIADAMKITAAIRSTVRPHCIKSSLS